jgi:hypothetical protein
MYEHHLPLTIVPLTKACGDDALRLFMELLKQAAIIDGRESYGYYSSEPISVTKERKATFTPRS